METTKWLPEHSAALRDLRVHGMSACDPTHSHNCAPLQQGSIMSDEQVRSSDLVEIARRSGDFRKHYGVVLGAFLYLRSISAARPRSIWWSGVLTALIGAVVVWIKTGWAAF